MSEINTSKCKINKCEVNERLFTSLIIFFAMFVSVFLGIESFKLFVTAIYLFIAFEWAMMVFKNKILSLFYSFFFFLGYVIFIWSLSFNENTIYIVSFVLAIVTILFGALWVYNKKIIYSFFFSFGYLFIGLIYVLLMLELFKTDFIYILILCVLVFSSISFDSFAYFIGKKYGRKKLCEKISPNKTLVGFVGGVIVTTILVFVLSIIFSEFVFELNDVFYIGLYSSLIAFFTSVFTQMGDLLQSFVKRQAGVKDSGLILKGHGGIFDRFDGYCFVFFVAGISFIGFLYFLNNTLK